MSNKEYQGYPEYVVICLPKSGTKSVHKCFASLGYKIYDIQDVPGDAKAYDDYGKKKITFAELTKVWEEKEIEVIVEPSGLYWYEMVAHWPKTKFIHLVRDVDSWSKSLSGFMKSIMAIPKGALMDHLFYHNALMSPTAHHALHTAVYGYQLYATGLGPLFLDENVTYEASEPWEIMAHRRHRMFHADVVVHAPKERTLLNYNIKDGWPKLRKFLGLASTGNDKFPHENAAAQSQEFVAGLWSQTDYDTKVFEELAAYMKTNGYELKKLPPSDEKK